MDPLFILACVVMAFFSLLSIFYLFKAQIQLRRARALLKDLNQPILVSSTLHAGTV